MKSKYFFVIFLLISAIFLSGCILNLNLLGSTRITVDGKVYSLGGGEELLPGQEGSIVTIWLSRVGGPTQESDAETISQVTGIVIVNPEGTSVGVTEVIYDGGVKISFETGGKSGPWTLIWPGYEPVLII
ncbi:MAG: hypothetical protein IMZ52_03910 [Actinobacteria bacterium]|nr:hypothetical protein [Actinomycetota bacterium]MBE3128265.1 hypothetical protein [Actinomycetota bacterium]